MNQTVEKGKTLLVDGPAAVCLVTGKAEAFGYTPKDGVKLIIREGKRLPFHATETATFSISLGAGADVEEATEDTIPQSWGEAYNILRTLPKKPVVIMIIGGTDSGKSSLCTYFTNRLLTEKCTVAILDCDLGQSDIGPPGTVGYTIPIKPVTDLFSLQPRNAFFVGETFPSRAISLALTGIAYMNAEVQGCCTDFLVVNTDGWVDGEEAVAYKAQVAELLKPDVVFCMDRFGELPSLCAQFGDALGLFRQERVEAPLTAKERSQEKRRKLRELGYNKYLAEAKVKSWSLSRLQLEETEELSTPEVKTSETAKAVKAKKKAIATLTASRGLLLGLADAQGRFLGIGVSHGIDFEKKTLRVSTTAQREPARVQLGKVQLDRDLHEISI